LKRLIDLVKIPQDVVDKWLTKANSETFEEMNTSVIERCIDYVKKQIKGED